MARKKTRTPLNVYLNARLVGRLRRETSGAVDFHYDQSWLDWESCPSAAVPLNWVALVWALAQTESFCTSRWKATAV